MKRPYILIIQRVKIIKFPVNGVFPQMNNKHKPPTLNITWLKKTKMFGIASDGISSSLSPQVSSHQLTLPTSILTSLHSPHKYPHILPTSILTSPSLSPQVSSHTPHSPNKYPHILLTLPTSILTSPSLSPQVSSHSPHKNPHIWWCILKNLDLLLSTRPVLV